MSLEVIDLIIQAEEAAVNKKAEAIAEAKRTVAAAEQEGRAALEQLTNTVKAELAFKAEQAQARAKAEVDEILQASELEKDGLRKKAENRFEQITDYIVERIVNG